jgi:hypothetical protein
MDEAGAGVTVTASGDVPTGFFGPVCFRGTYPNLALTAGTPFEVGSGRIGS